MMKADNGMEIEVWMKLNTIGGDPMYKKYMYGFLDTKETKIDEKFEKFFNESKGNIDNYIALGHSVNHIAFTCYNAGDNVNASKYFEFYNRMNKFADSFDCDTRLEWQWAMD